MWRFLRAAVVRPRSLGLAAIALPTLRLSSAPVDLSSSIDSRNPFERIGDDLDRTLRDTVDTGGVEGSVRRRPPRKSTKGETMSLAVLSANVSVYLLWWIPNPRFQQFMLNYFTTSYEQMTSRGLGGALTTVSSAFSHMQLWHLGANMLALASFLPRCVDGRSTRQTPKLTEAGLAAMYLTAGVLSSIGSNLFSQFVGSNARGLGASGALFGVLAYYTASYPDSRVLLMFIIDMSARDALLVGSVINAGLMASTWRAARTGTRGTAVDGAAHLVGTVVGLCWYYWKQSEWEPPSASSPARRVLRNED